jgi:hypothetical protein
MLALGQGGYRSKSRGHRFSGEATERSREGRLVEGIVETCIGVRVQMDGNGTERAEASRSVNLQVM